MKDTLRGWFSTRPVPDPVVVEALAVFSPDAGTPDFNALLAERLGVAR